jgi:cell division protease FtsH
MDTTDKKFHINFWYVIAAVLGMLLIQDLYLESTKLTPIPYSRFQTLLNENKVDKVAIAQNYISGSLKAAQPDGVKDFITARVDPDLAQSLDKHSVVYSGVVENHWLRDLLSWILPAIIFVGIWMFAIRRMGQGGLGGLMQIGKSRARIYVEKETKVTFADVAGVDEAKDELVEIVEFLKEPVRYGRLGGRPPKGVLLVGPPGTGKTLLARAVAGEAGVPFFSISGSEFVEMFVGVGAARVRDLFEQARQHAPAIIFIDELDALGRARGPFVGGGQDEKDQTLNQLLAELDGFDPSSGLVLLGATNRPEVLDPALLRAGRFDRQILVDRPDKRGREQILAVHLKKVTKLGEDVKPEQIAALTPGFTGADLANLVNEATLLATRRNAEAVNMTDFTAAIERMVAGLEKRNRLLNPLERRVVAYHELGHAMVTLALPGTDSVHKVSIIPHGVGALGYTIQRPTEDRYLMTRPELEYKMAGLLGGRASEQLVFREISTGAADDLARATDIARAMVLRYGMSEALGNVTYDRDRSPFLQPNVPAPQERNYSEETAEAVDRAVRQLVDGAFQQAFGILQQNRSLLDRTAAALLETETLDEPAIERLKGEIVAGPALPAHERKEVAAAGSSD